MWGFLTHIHGDGDLSRSFTANYIWTKHMYSNVTTFEN